MMEIFFDRKGLEEEIFFMNESDIEKVLNTSESRKTIYYFDRIQLVIVIQGVRT